MNLLVSFPRSGQNVTAILLSELHERLGLPFSYCENYCACNRTPCADGAWLQKHHDFGLRLELPSTARVVAMYRADPIDQLESYFRFQTATGIENGHLHSPLEYDDDLIEKLVEFIRGNLPYYRGFVDKWNQRADLVLTYDDYIADPVDSLLAMMRIWRPRFECPRYLVQETVDAYPGGIARKSRLDPEFRAELAQAVAVRTDSCGLA